MSLSHITKTIQDFLYTLKTIIPELKQKCVILSKKVEDNVENVLRDILILLIHNHEYIETHNSEIMTNDILPNININDYWNSINEEHQNEIWMFLHKIVLSGKEYFSQKYKDINDDIPIQNDNTNMNIRSNQSHLDISNHLQDFINETTTGHIITKSKNNMNDAFSKKVFSRENDKDEIKEIIQSPSFVNDFLSSTNNLGRHIYNNVNKGHIDRDLFIKESFSILDKSRDYFKMSNPEMSNLIDTYMKHGKLDMNEFTKIANNLQK